MTIITKAALAAELGLSKARISQYAKNGLPIRSDGKLDRETAVKWLNSKRLNLTSGVKGLGRASAIANEGDEPGAEGSEYEFERTRKLKLANDETERKLIPERLVLDVLDFIFGPALVEWTSFPYQMTDDVALRRRMEDEIDAMRQRQADRMAKAIADLKNGLDPFAGETDDDDALADEADLVA